MKRMVWVLPLLLLMTACVSDELVPRWSKPTHLAQAKGWSVIRLATDPFELTAVLSPNTAGDPRLTVFLEGDGLAYLGTHRVSPDPTPNDPMALRLALVHPGGNIAWLARPCQYLAVNSVAPACEPRHWTSDRYGPQVIASLDQAIDQLKSRFAARELVLVGYSGGGALAVLLAARRSDVVSIITVAAPLDTRFWTESRHLGPLRGSLNPADSADRIAAIPQLHLVGGRDEVVGVDVAQAYLRHQTPGGAARLVVVPDADHACCWVGEWHRLIQILAPQTRSFRAGIGAMTRSVISLVSVADVK